MVADSHKKAAVKNGLATPPLGATRSLGRNTSFLKGRVAMLGNLRAVLALSEIKAAIDEFETGDENAVDTLSRILEACMAANEPKLSNRDAA